MWRTPCPQGWAEREEGLTLRLTTQVVPCGGREWGWGTWSSLEKGVDIAFLLTRLGVVVSEAGVSLAGRAEGAHSQLSLPLWCSLFFLGWWGTECTVPGSEERWEQNPTSTSCHSCGTDGDDWWVNCRVVMRTQASSSWKGGG